MISSEFKIIDELPEGGTVPRGFFRVYNDGPGDAEIELVEDPTFLEAIGKVEKPLNWLFEPVKEIFTVKAGQMDERLPRSPYPIARVDFKSLDSLGCSCRVYKGVLSTFCKRCKEQIPLERGWVDRKNGVMICRKCTQNLF